MLNLSGLSVQLRRCLVNSMSLQARMSIKPFERNLISGALSTEAGKSSFKKLDTESGGQVDVEELG